MKDKYKALFDAIEKEFGGPAACDKCMNFEYFVKDPKTKEKYSKCKHYDHLPTPKNASRCYYYSNKDPRIRENMARIAREGEELERKMRPTWEEMHRPFTI